MKNTKYILPILSMAILGCSPEFEESVNADYSAGQANFSRYVSVGNSLTAGYMDGTVYRSGQQYSYPNLLAKQFATVGGGAFTQPSYADDVSNLGGLMLGGVPLTNTRLVIDASQSSVENITGNTTIEVSELQQRAYNNMGVPGAKSFHLLASGYGNVAGVQIGQANPYFVRHATSASATVLGDAMSMQPTFFTNWIGGNDVLAFATSGGAGVDHNLTGNLDPTTYGSNDITNSGVFANVYSTILTTLTQNGAKGVVCTIPSVTSIPYFTTIPYAPLPDSAITSNPQVALLAQLYQFLAVATGGRVAPLNTADGLPNPVLINDESLSDLGAQISLYATGSGNPLLVSNAAALGAIYGRARQSTSNDLIVLPARAVIGTTSAAPAPFNIIGVTSPMEDKWVLIPTEKTAIANATAAFNSSITTIAASNNVAVADMNAIMNQLVSGLRVQTGQIYTANYFSGSATEGQVLFSLDGVHPNARGYSVIANEILKVINSYYGANIPMLHNSYFPGINIVGSN